MAQILQSNYHKKRRTLSEINIIPFVDIVLVLLIIFMITAPLLQQGLKIELPDASSPEIKKEQKDIVLTIDKAGEIYLSDAKATIPMEQLKAKLMAAYRAKASKNLLIRADQDLQYGKVIDVMSIAQQAGVERIGMITQPERDQ